jgi:hypothetical protein
MVRDELRLKDPRFEAYVRLLSASVNTRILGVLVDARSKEADKGWRFLSEIAAAVGEAPGTVSPAIQKLLPLLEERREKGRRYFRARARVQLRVDYF